VLARRQVRARILDFWRLLSLRAYGSESAFVDAAGHLFLRQHRFDEVLAIRMVPEDRLTPAPTRRGS